MSNKNKSLTPLEEAAKNHAKDKYGDYETTGLEGRVKISTSRSSFIAGATSDAAKAHWQAQQPSQGVSAEGAPESADVIAQWVIDNRYPKSEFDKVSDSEMYHYLVEKVQQYALSAQPLLQATGVQTLIDIYDEYIKLLGDEISDLVGLHISHGGFESKRTSKGLELRNKIIQAKNNLK